MDFPIVTIVTVAVIQVRDFGCNDAYKETRTPKKGLVQTG